MTTIAPPEGRADSESPAPSQRVSRHGAASVAVAGLSLVLVAGTGVVEFDAPYLVGTEVLLTVAGFAVGSWWRSHPGAVSGRALAGTGARLLPTLWPLVAFVVLYAGLMATGPEIGSIRGSAMASAAGVTNWWLVFTTQSPLGAPSPLSSLWLPAVVLQATVVGSLVLARHRARAAEADRTTEADATAEPGESGGTDPDDTGAPGSDAPTRLPRGAVVAGIAGVAVTLWTALLAAIASASEPGSSPLGDPGSLPALLVRLLNVDGTYDTSRLAYGTDTRVAGFLFGIAAAYLLPRLRGRIRAELAFPLTVGGVGVLIVIGVTTPGAWVFSGILGISGALAAAVCVVAAAPTDDDLAPMRVLRALGSWWPAIFVWALPAAILAAPARSGLENPTAGAVAIVGALAAGILSATVLEPALRRIGPLFGGGATLPAVGITWILLGAVIVATFLPARQGLYVYQGADPEDRYPVVFAGDSMPYGLGLVVSNRELDTPLGLTARVAGLPGCGITTGALLNGDQRSDRLPECDDLMGIMDGEVRDSDPIASFMLVWAWELYDHEVDEGGTTTVYEVGTPEWKDRFGAVAQEAFDSLAQEGGVVVVLTMPCVDPDADTPNHPSTVAATEPWRVDEVNAMVRQLARWNRQQAVLVDLADDYLCPGGDYQAYMDGTLMSEDSVHFTEDGAEKLWNEYLAPALLEQLGLAEGPVE